MVQHRHNIIMIHILVALSLVLVSLEADLLRPTFTLFSLPEV